MQKTTQSFKDDTQGLRIVVIKSSYTSFFQKKFWDFPTEIRTQDWLNISMLEAGTLNCFSIWLLDLLLYYDSNCS